MFKHVAVGLEPTAERDWEGRNMVYSGGQELHVGLHTWLFGTQYATL